MKSLTELEAKATELLNKYELAQKGWGFDYIKAKRTIGYCEYSQKMIYVSKPVMLCNLENDELIIDTLLHEIAHAIAFVMYGSNQGHNGRWKIICRTIGAKPERVLTDDKINIPEKKNVYECPNCSREKKTYRKLKKILACGKCCREYNGGKFSMDYAFRLVKVDGVKIVAENLVV